MDQHGSRYIQKKIGIAADADKKLVYDEILPEVRAATGRQRCHRVHS